MRVNDVLSVVNVVVNKRGIIDCWYIYIKVFGIKNSFFGIVFKIVLFLVILVWDFLVIM